MKIRYILLQVAYPIRLATGVLVHCDIFFAGFFVATQFFFTLCFTLLLIASFLVALYLCCSREHERFVLLLLVIGTDLIIAGDNHGTSLYHKPVVHIIWFLTIS